MSRDLSAVLITVDRSPGPNYLSDTLANLTRGGLLTSERLCEFTAVCSRYDPDFVLAHGWYFVAAVGKRPDFCGWSMPDENEPARCANLNVAAALELGASVLDAKYVLFLEDDIDVCADFFDSVGAWLDDHAQPYYPFYPLGAAYPQVEHALAFGASAWEYPVEKFYGTQAVAFPAEFAHGAAAYLRAHCYDREADGTCYDLLLADYARELGVEYLLTPAPSLVQHTGRTSTIRSRPSTHTFDSWPGRDWSYPPRDAVATLRNFAETTE